MNYKLSKTSIERLAGVDGRLVDLMHLAIERTPVDFGIAWMGGLRNATEQHELYLAGRSEKDGYRNKSKHQSGDAVDIIPYVGGEYTYDRKYYLLVLGAVWACAEELGVKLRSGANWDGDDYWIDDQKFNDVGHIELL